MVVVAVSFDKNFYKSLAPALSSIVDGWKLFTGNDASKKWPELKINIVEPNIGTKFKPEGVEPVKYLTSLPELKDFIIADAKITYFRESNEESCISSKLDWVGFFNALEESKTTAALHTSRQTTLDLVMGQGEGCSSLQPGVFFIFLYF